MKSIRNRFGFVAIGLVAAVVGGTASAADLLVPSQYNTIQSAIDAAVSGDVVLISPGTHAGPIDLKGKAITVRGAGNLNSQVLINGGDSVVKCTTGEISDCVIENLTITGGTAISGGGVKLINSSPTFKKCRIILNTAAGSSDCQGGGVYVLGGAPVFEDCSISANSCSPYGSGTACGGHSDLRCVGMGGGVYLQDTSATLSRCTISGNVVSANPPRSMNPLVDVQAGGIWRSGSGSVTISNCLITTNSLDSSASGSNQSCCYGSGGGAIIQGLTFISGSKISNNSKSGCGDAIGGVKFIGVGIFMVNTQICSNSPSNLSGGYVDEGGNVISAICPETCTSDLNADGKVDSADIGLMLIDFGPCYGTSLTTPQQQEPFILQSVETPSPLLLNKK